MAESKQAATSDNSVVAIRFYHNDKQRDIRNYDMRTREGRDHLIRAISWATSKQIPFDGLTASAESPDKRQA